MSVLDLLSRLREANVDLWVDEDRLRFSAPPGALTPELRTAIGERKTEVMDLLRRSATTSEQASAIVPVAHDRPLPLSFPQRRMWFFEQVHPGTSTYHMATAWRISGALDVAALQRCFTAIARRHASLRTGFALQDDEPVQVVEDDVVVALPVVDLTALPDPDRDAEARRVLAEHATRPFDLTRAPLIRTTAVRTRADEHFLGLTVHHIVADMWSADVLLGELMKLYPRGDPDELPELPVQYADFAVWQRSWLAGDVLRDQLHYWTERLAGAPPFLDLPTDRPHPAVGTHVGAQESTTLPADLIADVDALCAAAGATRFMALLAAFHVLLARYSGETDIVVGTPIANRTRSEVEQLIGYFVNTLVLRVDLADTPTFTELLRRVRDHSLGAYEHQDTPVEQLVEALHPRRDPGRPPLFQVMFTLQNGTLAPFELPGLEIEELPVDRTATEFDLTLELDETDAGLRANIQYNADVFDSDRMRRLLGHWRTLLESVVADPDRPVRALPLLTGAERDLLLDEWNATDRPHSGRCVHDMVADQARRTPDTPAVIFRDRVLSYAELRSGAIGLAALLRDLGAARDELVAVCVERSPEMVVALLGVLESGAAYLPIDTTLPPERLAYMLEDAGVGVVVTTRAQRHRFDGFAVRVVLVDPDVPQTSDRPEQASASEPTDLAYVIYTSGSTGKPKGVMIEHGSVTNFVVAMDDLLGVTDSDDAEPGVWLAVTSVSFDIALLELLWPLTKGWRVVVQDDRDVLPGGAVRSSRASSTLDFSLFYFAASQDQEVARDRYRLLLDGARFADQHDFAAVWTPERHFDPFGGLYPNPSVIAAALAAITERVQLRAGSVVLPLHNPIRVAEEWSVVDNLSGGRVSLSFASGWHADDFALAPDASVYDRRKEAMLEQVEQVRALWRGEPAKVVNGVGREIEVSTFPRPVQAELPFWLTAAGNPETFRDAGAAGARLLTHLLGQSVAELAEKIAVYRRAWRDAGHEGEGHVALMVHTFVGDESATARDTVRGPFRDYLRTSFGLVLALAPSLGIVGEPSAKDVEELLDFAFDRYYDSASLIGTVDECAAMAERLRGIGVDEVACLIDFGVDADEVLACLPRLDEVRQRCAVSAAQDEPDFGVAAQIRRHGVTHLQCTPSLMGILVADPGTSEAMREVDTLIVGGEALPPVLAARLVATARDRVINVYGPTETTIWSTSGPVRDGVEVTIGRPIANTEVYIVDEDLVPLPVGVPGELCIGGQGVARGYLNRPELTSERFPGSPFVDGARLYRTGDRARYLPDGRIEFLGRVDRQVKLGGHRIELGEIESVLLEHPAVRQVAVTVREDPDGHRYLAAYLVAHDGPVSPAELRPALLRKLPEVMAPGVVIWLAELPLNSSGKVDYRALPDPSTVSEGRSLRSSVSSNDYVAPRDDTERTIATIWQDVLKVDRVGTTDNFFELGGHSLMAIQMVSRLRAALGSELTLRAVFDAATVVQLADRVRESGADHAAPTHPLRPVARPDGLAPLSFAQQRMWFFDQMNPGVVAYHLSAAFRLRGRLSPDVLHRAFNEIVRRHESLRTNFAIVGDEPAQVIAARRRIPLPLVDLSNVDETTREAEVLRLALDEPLVPFDLERDALLRTTLLRLGPAEHVLLLTTHHIVSDSWSIAALADELRVLYDAYSAGLPSPLPELPVQYADFAVWQRDRLVGQLMDEQLDYWRTALTDAPPVLELPYDRPRPDAPTHRGAQTGFQLSAEVSDGLKALSRDNDVTVFVTLLASFTVLLHRWAKQDHVVLGVPVAGRDLPELEPLIGFLGNATVIHNDLGGDPAFAEVLQRVRHTVIGAYDHQDLPVEKLVADLGVERDLTHNPLFQVMFVYINDLVMAPRIGTLEVTPLDVHTGSVFMDLNLAMEDTPDGLRGTVDYDTDLFDASTIDWLLESFRAVLAATLADPGVRVGALSLAPLAEPVTAAPPQAAEPADAVPELSDDAVPVVISSTFTANAVLESLGFWADRIDLPLDVELAPYNQVFQQLLDPTSVMAGNDDGVNIALLRGEDWNGPGAGADAVRAEFVQALSAFQSRHTTPFVVVLCPPTGDDVAADARWRARIAEDTAELNHVLCLDMVPVMERYGVADPRDPVAEEAGNIPYTPEFFAALGTCLVRQLAALVSDYPSVVVLDVDRSTTGLDEQAARLLAEAAGALAEQGRRVVVRGGSGLPFAAPGVELWPDHRPATSVLDAVALESGVSLGDCLYLSGDEAACAAVGGGRPDVLVQWHPVDVDELAVFLEHTWLLDPPGTVTPGAIWWKGAR